MSTASKTNSTTDDQQTYSDILPYSWHFSLHQNAAMHILQLILILTAGIVIASSGDRRKQTNVDSNNQQENLKKSLCARACLGVNLTDISIK